MVAKSRRYRASCSRHPRRHVWQCAACQRADQRRQDIQRAQVDGQSWPTRPAPGTPDPWPFTDRATPAAAELARDAGIRSEQEPGPGPSTGTSWRRRSWGRR